MSETIAGPISEVAVEVGGKAPRQEVSNLTPTTKNIETCCLFSNKQHRI